MGRTTVLLLLTLVTGCSVGCSSNENVSSATMDKDSTVVALVMGIANNGERFNRGSFGLKIEELRYVADDDGKMKPVKLFPETLRFKTDGHRVYYWRDGGNFSGDTKGPTEGTYEGLFDGQRSLELSHTYKSMHLRPGKKLEFLIDAHPCSYLGVCKATELVALLKASPQQVRSDGVDTVHGVACQVLEVKEKRGEGVCIKRYWIDPNHGFLPRRREQSFLGPDGEESLIYELDTPEVFEIEPGVWAPRKVRMELFHSNIEGFHTVRNITCESIDISVQIPDAAFVLRAPPDYYVHDYIRNKHYQPDASGRTKKQSVRRKRDPIYNEKVDAQAEIVTALLKATSENKQVLIVYGGNWCSWCYKLHDLFEDDSEIRRVLLAEYVLVLVDINTNPDIAKKYKIERGKGFPYLTVLNSHGRVVKNQNTGDLEKGSKHDRDKILAFLQKWK